MTVSVPTVRGRVYQLQSSDAVPVVRWSGSRLVVGNGAVLDISDFAADSPQKFYRLMRW